MSETETTVPMDDKALFDAATSDAAPETVVEQQPATEQAVQDAGPARDEHGRFAPKATEVDTTAKPEAAQTEQQQPAAQTTAPQDVIPPWRLREEAEARRAAEARANHLEAQARQYQQQLQQLQKPAAPPDIFEPGGFEKGVEQGVRQHLDPVARQLSETREYYSRKDAIREHGKETVQAAYGWFEQAVNKGDPSVSHVLQRALQSIDPFEDIVSAYKQHQAVTMVGTDPKAWFDKELARRKAEDPQFAAQFVQQPAQQQQNGQGAPATNIVKLPPSLTRASGTSGAAETGSLADGDLYAFATR